MKNSNAAKESLIGDAAFLNKDLKNPKTSENNENGCSNIKIDDTQNSDGIIKLSKFKTFPLYNSIDVSPVSPPVSPILKRVASLDSLTDSEPDVFNGCSNNENDDTRSDTRTVDEIPKLNKNYTYPLDNSISNSIEFFPANFYFWYT